MATITLPKGTTDLGTLSSLNNNILLIGEGNQTVTTGLDQSGLAAGIDSVYYQMGPTVNFRGTSGQFLKAGIVTILFLNGYGGTIYYTPIGAGTQTTCTRAKNIGANRLYVGGGGTITSMEHSGNAYTNVDDSSIITTLSVDGGQVDVQYISTAITTLYMSAGQLTIGRPVTTAWINGGNTVVTREDTASTPPAWTTINMGGGTLKWRGGGITTLRALGSATLDFSDVPAALTIGTLIVSRGVLERSTLKGRNFVVTISSLTVLGAEGDAILA